ncbi:MAG: hypothetical protein SNJ71_05995 [Bacteroidales bacterium]
MKKQLLFNLATAVLVGSILVSCGGLNTMLKKTPEVRYTVTPNPLEVHGDSVSITIQGSYPPKFFNKKATMDVTPVMVWDGGEKAFKVQKLQGEGVEANAKPISFETGGSFSYTDKIPYDEKMAKCDVVIKSFATLKGKNVPFQDFKVAKGTIATSRLLQNDAVTIMAVDQFRRSIPDSKELAAIYYLINKTDVRNSEMKKKDIQLMKKYLDSIMVAQNIKFTGLELAAFASPDGPQTLNSNLADGRGNSAKNYIINEYKKAGTIRDELIAIRSTAEDWEGFKKLMMASNIQDKELILRVLEMTSDLDAREKEIKAISRAYKAIAQKILPELRRSKFLAKFEKIGKSDAQLLEIGLNVNATAQEMNVEEYLRAATLTTDISQKETILKNAQRNYPDDSPRIRE